MNEIDRRDEVGRKVPVEWLKPNVVSKERRGKESVEWLRNVKTEECVSP